MSSIADEWVDKLTSFLKEPGPNDFILPKNVKIKNSDQFIETYRDQRWLERVFDKNEKQLVAIYAKHSPPPISFRIELIDGVYELMKEYFNKDCKKLQRVENEKSKADQLGSCSNPNVTDDIETDVTGPQISLSKSDATSVARDADIPSSVRNEFNSTESHSEHKQTIPSETMNETVTKPLASGKLKIYVIEGADSLLVSISKYVSGGIMQVASQFNALESPGPYITDLSSYPFDHTQGPRAVMPCAHALLRRQVARFNAFESVFSDPHKLDSFINCGYVEWGNNPEEFLKYISEDRIKRLCMLPMWVNPELGGQPFIQVYCAAPPTDTYGNGGDLGEQTKIAELLVIPQYRAIAELAVIRSLLTEDGVPIPLHLTFVGGGAFNNSPTVLKRAFKVVSEILKNTNVILYIHAFDYLSPHSRTKPLIEDLNIDGIITRSEFNQSLIFPKEGKIFQQS